MKNQNLVYLLIVLGTLLVTEHSCKEKFDDNEPNKLTDIDGNVYNTVTIGSQIWMVENLKVTKFNDGTVIPYVTNQLEWSDLTSSGYCFYDNNLSNKNIYGALYNGYAVSTGKLCPTGWHVPTNKEWIILTDYLGGENIAGGKLKEIGTIHWSSPNEGATNETGYTALPGGYRSTSNINFRQIKTDGFWWSSTNFGYNGAYYRQMRSSFKYVFGEGSGKAAGFSVRCIKD
ncbi:MAG: fibrobacter succinogenes major paralogous domain-containing protein [Mariniphaga sp.]|nr:fibrobacter succinogenes major paralogous domain-containing protein [Mariniphaga sp.]